MDCEIALLLIVEAGLVVPVLFATTGPFLLWLYCIPVSRQWKQAAENCFKEA